MAQTFNNRWEIVEPLQEGGQAHTFLVKDLRGDGESLYALKRLKNPARLGRFKREIETISNLAHPKIVLLKDFNLTDAKPYLVTDFCKGGSLADADPAWFSDPPHAFAIFLDVCEAIHFAHSKQVVHRDIKPANIFLSSDHGSAIVGDFGICYLEEADDRLTDTHEAVGPRLFMAPELEDGRLSDTSHKCDIYSLGKLLYWLLSSGKVFSREKYREEKWDLKTMRLHPFLETNIYMEHVTRLLDHMVVAAPDERGILPDIIRSVHRIKRLVEVGFNPVSSKIPQQCTYCGWGEYVLRAKGTDVHNFGFAAVGNPNWRVYVCDECGHVQMFRLDQTARDTWWEREK